MFGQPDAVVGLPEGLAVRTAILTAERSNKLAFARRCVASHIEDVARRAATLPPYAHWGDVEHGREPV